VHRNQKTPMSDFSLKSKPAHPARQHLDKLDGLQKSMLDALDEDQVKKQINDAKLRGVAQRVEYDDFEKLVKGAHLRPIKPRSTELDAIGKAFDGFVMPKVEAIPTGPLPQRPSAAAAAAAATAVPQPSTASVPSAPSSSNEFVRVWRRQLKTDAQRHAYVRQLDPAALPVLFRTELDAGLFDSIIGALADPLLARLEAAPGDASSNSKGGAPDAVAVESSRVTDSIEAMGIVDVSAGEKGAAATAAADAAVAADSTRATSDDTALHVDLTWAYAFLYQASRLNRFDLTLDFADKATITKLTRLFEAILARQGAGGGSGKGLPGAADVLSLRAAFQA
jgi:hypothetical protein